MRSGPRYATPHRFACLRATSPRSLSPMARALLACAHGQTTHDRSKHCPPPPSCSQPVASDISMPLPPTRRKLAASGGAVLADPEFVQFHPTAIATGHDPAPLASEALRGEGAILLNGAGERFMLKIHRDGDLAPRDVVARGVFAEIAAGRGAFLDARAAIGKDFPARFPTVYASCMAASIDPVHMLIPVAPAAHYHMGGVSTDARGRTSLDGLWAAGEVASTGVHGANRLASNSLLEAVVFASRVAEDISGSSLRLIAPLRSAPDRSTGLETESSSVRELRMIMSRHVGVIRSSEGLATALARISRIEREAQSPSLRNMATAALLVAAAAFARCESRGAHE